MKNIYINTNIKMNKKNILVKISTTNNNNSKNKNEIEIEMGMEISQYIDSSRI